ncbi:MAG: TonB-dependent receptor [Paludibacteraceae bacterium]|nr:TonB-dependent receptor [Paludibacteraceae bacterium]
MRQIFIVAFVLVSTLLSFSQRAVKAKVTDESGNPLQGATVFIKSESKGVVTDRNGKFVIEGLSRAAYQIEVSYVGYVTETLDARTNVDLNIVLKRAEYEISEITVTSVRANNRSAVAYTNVSKEDIEQRNMGQDIPYLLALTPGFVATSDAGTGIGYTGFRIRGTDANRTNITVNGVPLNDAESHGTFFVNMPDFASSLSSMQVQRGVGTSTNGAAAFGASINMQTEGLNVKPYAEISSTYGSFNTNKNTLKAGTGLLHNKFAFDARLSNVKSDGYIDRALVDMKSYYFSAGYYGEKSTVKFLTFGGNEKTYQAWNGVDSEIMKTNRTYNELGEYQDNAGNTQYYDNQTDNYAQTHYQLHWLQTLNSHLNFNATAHLTRGLGYYEDYKTGRKYKEYGLIPDTVAGVALKKTDLVRQKWLDNYFYGITYGLNYDTDRMNLSVGGAVNRYDGDHYGKVKWVRNANQLDMSKEWYRNNGVKDDANVYAKLNMETFEKLFASVDLQYRYIHYQMAGADDKYDEDNNVMRDITNMYEYHFFNPKFGLTYMPDKNNSVYASYSLSNREPNRNNYTERAKNEAEPRPERLFDVEAGYRYQSSKVAVGANLFFMDYKDQLILTGKISEIGELLTTNISDSYRTGLELTVGVKPVSWLKWDGNVTISQNKILNFIEQDVDMYDADWNWIGSKSDTLGTTDIAYSPNVLANSAFVFNFDRFELGLFSSFVGKQFFDNTSSDDRSIDAYFVNNLSLKYALPLKRIRGIDFQFMLNNLLNEKYESNAYTWYSYYFDGQRVNEKRYFPQAGINFLASVTLKF